LITRLVGLLIALAALLFIPAGRLDWWEAWRFFLAYAVFLIIYLVWGLRNDPEQLAERSRTAKNVKAWDKVILSVYSVLLLALLVVAGLDAGRFRWAPASPTLQLIGWIGTALGGALIGWVITVNTFLSRQVRIQDDRGQVAVTRGPYRVVRHPMYAGIIILFMSVPLVLGSRWALAPGALICALFVLRTALEDRTLRAELPGYNEYAGRVRYRLLPGIW
jgi:protein-S-isoprenylcysteine O-methyltransferase Ste14